MGVVRSMATVKEKIEGRVNMWMLLGYVKNHTSSTYHMLNLRTERIILRHDVIWLNKTYSACISRKLNTKSDTCILKDRDESYY